VLRPPNELLGFERNKIKGTKEKISLFSLSKQRTLTQRGMSKLSRATS
jgi:hypothetical protein